MSFKCRLALLLTFMLICVHLTSCSDDWSEYKKKFGKVYDDDLENTRHMAIYNKRKETIEKHNRLFEQGLVSYSMAINKFSDQFTDLLGDNRRRPHAVTNAQFNARKNNANAPTAIDWSKKGRVTDVKNQGDCHCSWAFGVIGSLEGLKAKQSGLVTLSAQNLIDCSRNYGTNGCQVSLADEAIRYVIDNQGIASEQDYPYQAADNVACNYEQTMSQVQPSGYLEMTSGDEEALRQVTGNLGPVTVTLVSTANFFSYSTGIFYDNNCTIAAGAVHQTLLVVGYDSSGQDNDYWILKSSYGTQWGEAGYMRMARNKGNMCGIASMAFIPVE